MNCIPITNKIRELAKEFPGESERTIANLVGIWQSVDPNSRVEKYPTIKELKTLIENLRKPIFSWSNTASSSSISREESKTESQTSPSYYEGSITPEKNTIFVFGSNPEGRHGAGAAKVAREQFGAIYGQGEGLQGSAYALPTKDLSVKFIPFGKDDIVNEPLEEGVYNVYYDTKRSTSDNPISYLIKKIKDNKVTYVETYTGKVNGRVDDIEVPNSEKTVTEAEFRAITGRDKESFTYSNSYGFANVNYTGKKTTDGHGIYSIEINIPYDENRGKGIGSKMYEDIIDKLAEQGDYITPGNVVATNHKWEALQKQGRTKEVTLENGEHILIAVPKNKITQNRDYRLRSISKKTIIENIKKLYEVARQNPNKQFKVAYRNTDRASLNGYTGIEMIDMFLEAGNIPSNIVFSKEWIDTGKFNQPKTSITDITEEVKTESVHNGRTTIQYTPKGKQRQTYTIVGNKIYNKQGKEVFKTDSVDRNKIFANLAVQQGRAVVVEYRNAKYVVNNREQIISVTTGKMMQWEEGNGDRKQILREAYHKLKALQNTQPTINQPINNKENEAKQQEATAEFRRVQEASRKLLKDGISSFQQGEKQLTDEDKGRIGRILQRFLESKRYGGWNGVQFNLKHTNKDSSEGVFNIGKVSGNIFHDIFEVVRTYLPNGELVDLHDDYSECKCFIASDGLCGFAIEPDGNLVSVFSLSPSTNKGFLYAIKDLVLQEGATHLDAYASPKQPLQEIYAKTLGFHTASTMDYNMEYDHDNIASNHSNPQVVFMVNHEVENPKHFDKDSYDAAQQYQLDNIDKTPVTKVVPSVQNTNTGTAMPSLVIVPSSQTIHKAKTTGGIDTLRHPDKNGMHFGNPFATRDAGGIRKVMPTIRDTVVAYEQWLRGEEYQDIEPERRQWILNQIESGNLDNRDLIYYTDKVPDNSYGRDTYDYYEAPNHAHILQKLIAESIERRQQEKTAAEEAEKNKAKIDEAAFNTPEVVTVAEMAAADLTFDPKTRRDRVTLIANWFSAAVDAWIDEQGSPIKNQIDAINKELMETPNLSEEERDKLNTQIYDLEGQLNNLDRKVAIDTMKPSGIFNKIKNIFEEYINDTDENRIAAELATLNKMKGIEKYTEEQKLKAARKKADYKLQEYQKVLDNFRALADEACTIIRKAEALIIDINAQAASEDINLNDDDPEGNAAVDDMADDSSKEESYKDGWMTNYKHVSSHESLSQATRKAIMKIPKLNYKGKYEKDDLGNNRYLDADYVHAVLIDKLRFMITAEDMIPMLTDLAKTKPWVKQIIKKLQADDVLFSQFYQDFRKDFVQYWIQKKINNADGTFTIQTVCLNRPEGIYYLLDNWRDNYETGTLLDDDSIYNTNGTLNKENARKGLTLVKELTNTLNTMGKPEIMEKVQEEETLNKILKLLHMIGANPDPAVLKIALANDKSTDKVTYTAPVLLLLPELNIIFSGVLKGAVEERADEKAENAEEGTERKEDLINTFSKAYSSIATMVAEVTEDAIESSVRENNKSYYSHLTPSYLGKIIKELKDVRNDPEKFEAYIKREFKQYDWFYDQKTGEWRSDWIKRLATDSNARKMLDHKVLLSYDKTEYSKWDSLDYTIVLLNEFWSDPSKKAAWYYVPILSDAPSAEFIKFVRYMDGTEIDEDGNKLSYKESITNKLIDLVNQEYDRIMLVRERAELIKKGAIKPIKNFDIDGSKGEKGDKFKFLPQLNTLTYENGETFMQRFERLRQGSPSEFKDFLKDTIKQIMDQGFKEAYATWAEQGLLDELPNGKYKNLPFTGVSKGNERLVKALQSAKTIIQDNTDTAITGNVLTSIDNLIKAINNKKVLDEKQVNTFLNTIKSLLDKTAANNSDIKNINMIKNSLVATHNVAQDELENYYWNSTFATSQIIEMTTTDLAFYKNLEDFQKRFKEVHAPSLRLNTNATFRGKPIGRQWERTIYLKDEEIISLVLKDVEEIFEEQVKQGKISKIEKDYIISQFKKVNVADAQAYRSLSSYRAMMGMMGQWTDQMEHAYQNLANGKWDMQDFNIIWQTKKPYLYTQINNESGIEGASGIKTPVQHKNSEYLLLAIYDAIANSVGRSSKLKAINDFMEENQIDVVQFESTTKVGGQGIIDLSGTIGYDDTLKVLKEKTGIAAGKENPSVIHSVSYEDYGIQTATPEHAIDAVQLVGTQIRKLITADLDPKIEIEIDGVVKTKQEWLDFYNEINTENIIDSFTQVSEVFKDPKNIEKRLLEEIKGNTRYSRDLINACTLDENGRFNIPLYDPVQSQRVQQLLNSIIKGTITKQKIKGGALIQASCYGLTDDLKIVFEGEGENKRIKYLECYMPAYSKEFYKPLMDENGVLDANKLPEDLRRLIGYRVPTESKYSMVPLRIKGFLPQQTGSAIMLPAEITTLSGSD